MTKKSNVIEVPQFQDVTLTKGEVIALMNSRGFNSLVNNEVIPASIKYWLRRFRNELISITKTIEELRMERLNIISEKDENGKPKKEKNGSFVIPDAERIKFEEEFTVLLKEEAELPFKKIIIDLATFPENTLSAASMNEVECIVVFIEPKEEEGK